MTDVLSRFLLDHLSEPVIVLDASGKLIEANRAAREAEDGPDIAAPFQRAKREPGVTHFIQQLQRTRSARFELPSASGKATSGRLYLQGVAIDDHFVVSLERSAKQAQLEAELSQFRRVETLGLLTARIVHDVNNLLTPVLIFTRDLVTQLEGRGDDTELVQEVETTLGRAVALLKDVLGFARPQPAQSHAVNLNSAITAMRPILDVLVRPTITISLSLDARDLPVSVNRAQLEQTLLNLVSNAKDAMPHGGQINIATSQATLTRQQAGELRLSPHAVLTVNDTGIGMTEDVRVRALDAFFTTRAASGGTGLGLSSVQQFVKDSQGLMTLDSEAGRGTTVIIHLPRAEALHA